jgi:hypothetical protein
MARIPTYQGRIGLDPSALSGASLEGGKRRADISVFKAQAEAAQSLFSAAGSLASKLSQEEERQERNDARLWLYENASKFEAASARHRGDLEIEQNADDYASDADTHNLGEKSFSRQRLNWFSNHQNEKDTAGKATYNPPNKYAQQMWSEYLAKQRGSIELEGIQFEAELRVQSRYNQAERILDGWTAEVAEDHTKLDGKIGDLQRFIEENELDAKEAEKYGDRVYLDSATLQKLGKEKKQEMLRAHLDARLAENPFDVYLHIEGKGKYKDKPFGSTKGLDPNLISQYRDEALRKSAGRLEQDVATVQNNATAYLTNIAAGGDGGDYKQSFAAGAARQTFAMGYGGALGNERLALFPGVQKRHDAAFADFQSRERVAMTTAGLVKFFESEIATKDVAPTMTLLRDAVKNTNVRDAFIKELEIEQEGKKAKLDSAEMQAAIEKAQARITATLKLRSEDPVQHAVEVDDGDGGFANVFHNNDIAFEEKVEILDSHYDKIKQPKYNRPLLTNAQAETIVDTVQRASSGDDLIAQMKGMREKYGEHYPRVWKQLTSMKNGLDANYGFLGSIPNSMFMTEFAEAMRVDEKNLKEFFSSTTSAGTTYNQVAGKSVEKLTPYFEAFHGNMTHRLNEVAPLVDTFTKMVAIQVKKGLDVDAATNRVASMMTSSVTLVNDNYFSFSAIRGKNDDHFNFYITPDMQTEDGGPIDPDIVAQNASEWFDDIEKFFEMNPSIHVPEGSSYALQNSEEMGRETFIEAVKNDGKLVMNDTGDGLMLVVPVGDDAVQQPVKFKKGDKLEIIEFKFDYFMSSFK